MMRLTKDEFRVEIARTMFAKARGLMLRKSLDHALVMPLIAETRRGASIHSMFMRFTFDALFLNERLEVVDMATIKPWMLNFTPQAAAKYVVELPEYAIVRNLVNVGDVVDIDEITPGTPQAREMRIAEYEKAFEKHRFDEKSLGERPGDVDRIRTIRERKATLAEMRRKKLTADNRRASQKGIKKGARQVGHGAAAKKG